MNISPLANSPAAIFTTPAVHSSASATAGSAAVGSAVEEKARSADAKTNADSQAVEAAAKSVENFVQGMARNLHFTIDPDVGATVVRVIDTSTNEVIRQIPSEEMLAIAKAIDNIKGLFIQQQA